MTRAPILLAGGSGFAGRRAARYFREANPEVPLLIGGRDVGRARAVAAEVGNAEAVAVDMTADDLGLGGREVGAVAVLLKDEALTALRFAQGRGVPHLSISSGASELGPEVAAFIHAPQASAVVLGAEWLVGAASLPTLLLARDFRRVDAIAVGALLDEEDTGGPAVAEDMKRLTEVLPAALTRRGGAFVWRHGEEAKATVRAIDGTEYDGAAFSPFDVMGLAMATGAPDVSFDLATGVSSSRRRGEPMSTEILIEIAGEGVDGAPLRLRRAVIHPDGEVGLTGLGIALLLERMVGLGGRPALEPGLYFPYQLIEPDAYLVRLEAIGGAVVPLDA